MAFAFERPEGGRSLVPGADTTAPDGCVAAAGVAWKARCMTGAEDDEEQPHPTQRKRSSPRPPWRQSARERRSVSACSLVTTDML